MTEVCKADPLEPDRIIIRKAAEIIKKGGLVAFPTETVYGLGADALNPWAVRRIYAAKGRPVDNPLIVHVADKDQIYRLTKKLPEKAEDLIRKFFPGPLTIVLDKKEVIPDETTAGLHTVAIRMPSHRIALALIKESGTPIAAPSANKAGRPSPTKAQHVLEDLNEEVDLIIDGGATEVGLESTVVDLTVKPPQILRPGGVTIEMLREVCGRFQIHPAVSHQLSEKEIAKSPGMKYRHYAPKASLTVIVGKEDDVQEKIIELIHNFNMKGLKIGVATTTDKKYRTDHLENLGESKEEIAKGLFDVFRKFDKAGVDVILAEGVDEEGLGLAIMNRLKKASGYKIIEV
jgi:L-threonylcarbamoyladenylate synthase